MAEPNAENTTQLVFLQGDVFQAAAFGVDGLAVFYGGLSAIRILAEEHQADAEFTQSFRCIRYVDLNRERQIECVDDMERLLVEVLDQFVASGCRVVAMNGLRCDERPDPHVRSEKYQIQFIEKWLGSHPGVFDKICLIDLRDGFHLADTLI